MSRNSSLLRLIALTALAASISGCMVGPDYQRPGVYINQDFMNVDSEKNITNESPVELISWWDRFNDPTLSSLVYMGVSDNLSLKQYAARIYQYQAQIGVVRSDMFPAFRESGMYNYNKSPSSESQSWSLSTDMSWEPDFL